MPSPATVVRQGHRDEAGRTVAELRRRGEEFATPQGTRAARPEPLSVIGTQWSPDTDEPARLHVRSLSPTPPRLTLHTFPT
ncbi:hypothetical protein ACF06W_21425 [Streptomyces albus]|uniref:hypothetical protein n=1 Tax=Streptomyces albus TaxID=1888 RepID=UPI0037024291